MVHAINDIAIYRFLRINEMKSAKAKVAPLDKMSVVFTILLSFLILKEPLTPKVIAAGLLITLGAIVLIWK